MQEFSMGPQKLQIFCIFGI